MKNILHSLPVLLAVTAVPAYAAPPSVVVDLPAVGSLVKQVMGDLGSPKVLLPAGASPHHYQMKPSDAAALQDADLLLWIGPKLTPWLERSAANMAAEDSVELLGLDVTYRQDFGESEAHDHEHEDHDHDHDEHADHDHDKHEGHDEHADHDHDKHEGHDEHADHDHDKHEGHDEHADHDHGEHEGHSHSGLDPHVWLDPHNGIAWLDVIAGQLSDRDPENAATYAANAKAAATGLTALNDKIAAQLEPLHEARYIVFHDAYGYFTAHYGLQPADAVALGDASPPSAAHLDELRTHITEEGITCAFPEAQHNPKLIDSLIAGTDVKVGGTLDPTGSSLPMGPGLYGDILSGLANTLSDCLNG